METLQLKNECETNEVPDSKKWNSDLKLGDAIELKEETKEKISKIEIEMEQKDSTKRPRNTNRYNPYEKKNTLKPYVNVFKKTWLEDQSIKHSSLPKKLLKNARRLYVKLGPAQTGDPTMLNFINSLYDTIELTGAHIIECEMCENEADLSVDIIGAIRWFCKSCYKNYRREHYQM